MGNFVLERLNLNKGEYVMNPKPRKEEEMTIEQAVNRVRNFRDRYIEWSEKDNEDINVKALNKLIEVAEQKKEAKPTPEKDEAFYKACEYICNHPNEIKIFFIEAMKHYLKRQ